jgi:AraC-like DNA-binding protein
VSSHLDELRALVLPRAPQCGGNQLGIPGALVYRADAPEVFAKRSASTLSVGVVLQGRKQVRIDGEILDYDEAHCIVLTGELDYEARVLEASAARPYLSLVLAVPPDLVARTLLELAEVEGTPPRSTASASRSAFLAHVDDEVLAPLVRLVHTLDDAAERRVIAPLALHELVFRLLRSDAALALRHAACRGGDEGRIAEAMAFIRANSRRKLTIEQLAKRAAMSPSHFAHRFRDVARVSPMRYLKHVRLEQARVLLVQHGSRASEVAERIGYGSLTHFTRDFKQQFGLAPGQYARAMTAASDAAGSGKSSAAVALASRAASA